MTVPISMLLHRSGTDAFVDAAATPIVLTPVSESWSGGSKSMSSGDDREVQDFRIIWAPSTGIVTTAAETTRKFDFVLVGRYDAEVAIGDFWDVEEQHNVIEYIYPSNGYEVKCGGTSYGSKPSG